MSGLVFDEEVAGYPAQFLYLPTGSGTVLSGGDNYGRTMNYTPGQVWVWVNGDKVPAPDLTATDGSTITLNTGYSNGDVIDILTLFTVNSPNAIAYTNQQSLTTGQQKQARANAGVDDRNILINSDFRINQRVYVSAAALAAGAYGHDRWKAGASGGDYSFTQLASSTQITIAASKSVIQVVEDRNVEGGTYVLSWTGTAQARAGVNSATPSGSYSGSPLIIAGQTAGTVMSVEFNTGTLGKVKLELGSVPTPFVMPEWVMEMNKCLRYFFKTYSYATSLGTATFVAAHSFPGITTFGETGAFRFPVRMRAAPAITLYSSSTGTPGNVFANPSNVAASATNVGDAGYVGYSVGFGNNVSCSCHISGDAEL